MKKIIIAVALNLFATTAGAETTWDTRQVKDDFTDQIGYEAIGEVQSTVNAAITVLVGCPLLDGEPKLAFILAFHKRFSYENDFVTLRYRIDGGTPKQVESFTDGKITVVHDEDVIKTLATEMLAGKEITLRVEAQTSSSTSAVISLIGAAEHINAVMIKCEV